MKIESLGSEQLTDFVEYCKKHRRNIDDSFLYDEDLKNFTPNEENPTYIVVNDQNEIIAAASLIIDEYNRKGKKGRFRILHAAVDDMNCYTMLKEAILKHKSGLDKLNVFVPLSNEKLMKVMEELEFIVERYSYILVRDNQEVPEINLPEDYEIRSFRPGIDEAAWCEVRNTAFAKLQGSETPKTPEMIAKMAASEAIVEGGMMILYHGEKPVGVVMGEQDEYEDFPIMNIGPLAILPEYQGKGLGRALLRASVRFAREKGYDKTILCVNAENERAKALYIQEGFKQVEGAVCYKYEL